MLLNMLNDLAEAMKALDGKKNFVLVLIRFASEAWPRASLAEPRSASIAGFRNTGAVSSREQKGKDCHDQDKQEQGASFGFVFGI